MGDFINPLQIAEDSVRKLHEVWDDIGVSSEDRRQQLIKLGNEVKHVYEKFLTEEEELRSKLRQNIILGYEKICSLANCLGFESFDMVCHNIRNSVVILQDMELKGVALQLKYMQIQTKLEELELVFRILTFDF